MYYYATIYQAGGFFIIGGTASNNIVHRYDVTNKIWKNIGKLQFARSWHAVVHDGQYFYLIGGTDNDGNSKRTEKCTYKEGKFSCWTQQPTLSNFGSYPEVFSVSPEYCLKE